MGAGSNAHGDTAGAGGGKDRGDFVVKGKVLTVAVDHGFVVGLFCVIVAGLVGGRGCGFQGPGAVGVDPEGPECVVEVEDEDGRERKAVREGGGYGCWGYCERGGAVAWHGDGGEVGGDGEGAVDCGQRDEEPKGGEERGEHVDIVVQCRTGKKLRARRVRAHWNFGDWR